MLHKIFKEVFVFFYKHAQYMQPKKEHREHKIGAAGMTGLIGGSLGMNVGYILYKFNYLPHNNTKLNLFVFMVFVAFSIYFYTKGEQYLNSVKDLKAYKPKGKVVFYYFVFCFFFAGLSILFLK